MMIEKDPNHNNETPLDAVVPPELRAYLTEARRLFEEADGRIQSGSFMSALSSLTAVMPLHKMLMTRCTEMLNPPEVEEPPDHHAGYL